jgi:hypothetical protein
VDGHQANRTRGSIERDQYYRVERGRIAEHWGEADTIGMLVQMASIHL